MRVLHFGLPMRQTDQKAVGRLFSIISTYMYIDLIQLALDIKWLAAGNETNDMNVRKAGG